MARRTAKTRLGHSPTGRGRYTPPLDRQLRLRPVWHRAVGALLIALGAAIFVVNDFARVLPGGHNEGYAGLALLVAGSSTWFFGLFDRVS